MSKEEDVFDRFTDPVKKRKKKRKRQAHLKEKHEKVRLIGKIFAKDKFNEPMSTKEFNCVKSFVTSIKMSREDIEKLLKNISIEDIPYTLPKKKEKGLACVFEFINCAHVCVTWLNQEFLKIGWTENMTAYNAVSVSHCSPEVLEATIENLKMAGKQMLKFLEFDENIVKATVLSDGV